MIYNNRYQKLLESPFRKDIDQMRSDIENFYLISELRAINYTNKNIESIGLYLRNNDCIIHNYGIHSSDEFIKSTFIEKYNDMENIIANSSKWDGLNYLDPHQIYYSNKNKTIMPFIKTISRDGSIIDAAVLLFVKKGLFEQVLPSPNMNNGSFAFLIDDTDKIIAGIPVNENQILNYLSYDENITKKTKIENEEYFVLSTGIKDLPWKLIMYVPIDSFYHIRSYSLFVYEIAILLILIVMLLFFFVAFKKYKPVKKMISHIKNSFTDYNAISAKDGYSFIEKTFKELESMSKTYEFEIENTKHLIREQLIITLLSGQTITQYGGYKNLSDIIRFNFEDSSYMVALFELYNLEDSQSNGEIACNEFYNLIIRNLNEDINVNFICKYNNKNILLFDWPNNINTFEKHFFKEIISLSAMQFEQSYKIKAIIGVGTIVQAQKNIKQSFCEASEALSYSLLKGSETVYFFEDIEREISQPFFYPLELESSLLIALNAGNIEKVNSILDKILEENLSNRPLDLFSAKCLYHELCATFNKGLKAMGIENDSIYVKDIETNCPSIRDIIIYMKETFRTICDKLSNSENSNTLTQVIVFVDENYLSPDLSQKYLAKKFKISTYSISRIFNQNMFSGFQDYINRKRVSYSKHLLKQQNESISNIANLAGFKNENTFIRVFKQYEGMTPGQYRTKQAES